MGRLILAEPGTAVQSIDQYYINMPTPDGRIVKVREDYFDSLPRVEWENVMQGLAPYNEDKTLSGFKDWVQRKREARAERRGGMSRQEFRLAKQEGKFAGREAVAKAGGGIGGLVQRVGNIITGGGQTPSDTLPTRDFQFDASYGGMPAPSQSIFDSPYFWPVAGGLALGGLYLLTRK